MVAKQTTAAREGKQAERERRISEMEHELGSLEDHPESEAILRCR